MKPKSRLLIIILGLIISILGIIWTVKAQWREHLNAARYRDHRVESFSEITHNGDDVLVIYFSSGRKLTIRARQSHLIYINQ